MTKQKNEKVVKVEPKLTPSEKLLAYMQNALYALIAVVLFGFLANKVLLTFEKNLVHKSHDATTVDIFATEVYWVCHANDTNYDRTVIIEAAEAGTHASFAKLAHNLLSSKSPSYRVCTYDRLGKGFSGDYTRVQLPQNETAPEGERFVKTVLIEATKELYKKEAKNKKPLFLVGHSFGANLGLVSADSLFDGIVLVDPIVNEAIEERRKKDVKIALFLSLSGGMRLPYHTSMVRKYLSQTYSWFSLASVEHDSPKYDKKMANINMRTQRTFDAAKIELESIPFINTILRTKLGSLKNVVVINTDDQVEQLESDHLLAKHETSRKLGKNSLDAAIIEELNKF
jgi:pimeloyl-ACP methyl ester carboxylesterase